MAICSGDIILEHATQQLERVLSIRIVLLLIQQILHCVKATSRKNSEIVQEWLRENLNRDVSKSFLAAFCNES